MKRRKNYDDDPPMYGGRMRELRIALNLSQRELAHEWGISWEAISRKERGLSPISKLEAADLERRAEAMRD